MSWIAEVSESAAEGRLKECYERIRRALGRVLPFYRTFSSSPRLLTAHLEFYGALGAPGALSKLRREYIATAVSAENGCAH
jgi:alkylhydroperoxidase family enzyme